MPTTQPVDTAAEILRSAVDEHSSSGAAPLRAALDGFRRFAEIDFEVVDGQDTDGCLIEYGISESTGQPLFYINLLRQFEQCDDEGDHESYLQVSCEVFFTPDDDLRELGHRAEWWFRSGTTDFATWWDEQSSGVWAQTLSARTPLGLEIDQDEA